MPYVIVGLLAVIGFLAFKKREDIHRFELITQKFPSLDKPLTSNIAILEARQPDVAGEASYKLTVTWTSTDSTGIMHGTVTATENRLAPPAVGASITFAPKNVVNWGLR